MQPKHGMIRWHRPQPMAPGAVAGPVAKAQPRQLDLGPLLQRVGIPVVEDAETAREVALTLLGVAAEVEHAFMVQYSASFT